MPWPQFEKYNAVLRQLQEDPEYRNTILMLISAVLKLRKRTTLEGNRLVWRGLSVSGMAIAPSPCPSFPDCIKRETSEHGLHQMRDRVIHANNDATPRLLACVQGGVLPLDLLLEDEFGSRGGAESAFMSTSTNLTEAAKYATRGVSLASAILPPNSVAVFRESGGEELRGPSGERPLECCAA